MFAHLRFALLCEFAPPVAVAAADDDADNDEDQHNEGRDADCNRHLHSCLFFLCKNKDVYQCRGHVTIHVRSSVV